MANPQGLGRGEAAGLSWRLRSGLNKGESEGELGILKHTTLWEQNLQGWLWRWR
jgi:hypothetical protein